MIKMILAVDEGGSIGWQDGRLPWKIPSDMARFKTLTSGSTVLMGRKTFDSLNRPMGLPNRRNVVLSRSKRSPIADNPCFFQDGKDGGLETFAQVHQAALGFEPKDLWIIGGAQVYAQAIEKMLVNEIHLTVVKERSGGDVVFSGDFPDYNLFITRERKKRNIRWLIADQQNTNNPDEPKTSYIKLVKE